MTQEYQDFLLIKNLYHCTPEELENQDYFTTDLHANFLGLEGDKSNLEDMRDKQKAKFSKK